MTDGDALLRAILENPADDTARLVYADWLEENREADRAEFVRDHVAVRHERTRAEVEAEAVRKHTARMSRLERGDPNLPHYVALPKHRAWSEYLRQREAAVTRVRQACITHGMREVPEGWEVWPTPFLPTQARKWEECNGPAAAYSRGFVAEVRLPLAAFLAHAGSLFRAHPVTRVVLTDLRPNIDHADSAGIFDGDTYDLWFYPRLAPDRDHSVPRVLMDCLREMFPGRVIDREDGRMVFESKTWEDAYEAVSRSAVAHGRDLAGLPPLPAEAAAWA